MGGRLDGVPILYIEYVNVCVKVNWTSLKIISEHRLVDSEYDLSGFDIDLNFLKENGIRGRSLDSVDVFYMTIGLILIRVIRCDFDDARTRAKRASKSFSEARLGGEERR